MLRWFFYGVSALVLSACGDGYAGGPDDLPPEYRDDLTISITGGPEATVKAYAKKKGTGDSRFTLSLKEGINIIAFKHVSFYGNDKDTDAIFSLKKGERALFYITKKSLGSMDESSTYRVYDIEADGLYDITIDVPGRDDEWELYFVKKSALGDDLKSYFPDAVNVEREEGSDILYKYQWHLENNGGNDYTVWDAVAGNDINVKDVWDDYTGKGVTVAVIDQGIEINHPDLVDNIDIGQSWNYLTQSHDTTPVNSENAHGTAVAGIIAASAKNGIGGRGVAPDASLVSINMLESQSITDWSLSLESLVRGIDDGGIDIYNNSWGKVAGTVYKNEDTIGSLYYQYANQLGYGTAHGRQGKGAIYVKSAGNDRVHAVDGLIRPYWNANLDPDQVERFIIVVGASKADGCYAVYSTAGSNLLLNAPGGYIQKPYLEVDQHMVVTTDLSGKDRGYDYRGSNGIDYHFDALGNENYDYTNRMNGTSAAGPIVSGVAALMLEANPELTWRDIRYILATTATKNGGYLYTNSSDCMEDLTGYCMNAAGYSFSNTYGFGRPDAQAAVELAMGWTNLGEEKLDYNSSVPNAYSYNDSTDENLAKAERDISISGSTIEDIEYVNLEFSLEEVESEDLTFDNDHNDPEKLSGYYMFEFKMSDINATATYMDVNMTCGGTDVEIFRDIRITSGSASANALIPYEFLDQHCRVYFGFDNDVSEGDAAWSLKLTKGDPVPDSSHIRVRLYSPGGTPSVLLDAPNGIESSAEFYKTRLGSNAFLGESADGVWTLKVEETLDYDEEKDEEDLRAFVVEDIRLEVYGH